jgi:hypothetical protein
MLLMDSMLSSQRVPQLFQLYMQHQPKLLHQLMLSMHQQPRSSQLLQPSMHQPQHIIQHQLKLSHQLQPKFFPQLLLHQLISPHTLLQLKSSHQHQLNIMLHHNHLCHDMSNINQLSQPITHLWLLIMLQLLITHQLPLITITKQHILIKSTSFNRFHAYHNV